MTEWLVVMDVSNMGADYMKRRANAIDGIGHHAEPERGELGRDFEATLARMQTPQSRAAVETAFKSSPNEMGRAALAAARWRASRRRRV
jgi:hypothetical protein